MSTNKAPQVSTPTFEQYHSALGIGVASPRVSWSFQTDPDALSDWKQTAYDIEVYRGGSTETYHVVDSSSILNSWPSSALQSREAAKVRARVYGTGSSSPSDWSPWAALECALLEKREWQARPITVANKQSEHSGNTPRRPWQFYKSFKAPSKSAVRQRSRLYITSLGVYSAFINGNRVGDHCMAPGWTSYNYRLNYQTFDVTDLIKHDQSNTIVVEVAEGWYAGRLGFHGGRSNIYGSEIGPLVQLEIGTVNEPDSLSISSDQSWSCRPSAIISSGIYDGEAYDAREEFRDLLEAGSEDRKNTSWWPVAELQMPIADLVAPEAPPVRVTQELAPIAFLKTPSGKAIIDFGQNMVGRLLIRSLHKPKGHAVTFTHAEVLENGELGLRPLRIAKCQDTVISNGSPITNWSPQYSFHGFRYVQVDGWSQEDEDAYPLDASKVCAQVMHTDMIRTGHFSCSLDKVNKLHENACWSMRGNFLSIPTDCPQRDERLGWTGDIQAFCPSANFLYNTAGMLGDWLKDVSAEQLNEGVDGVVPFVVPNVVQDLWPDIPQAVWDDVCVLTPWALYRSFGDQGFLYRQYASMVAWLDRGVRRGPDRLWDPELCQLGDWLDPTAPPDQPDNARTTPTLVADAYLVHVTAVLAQISKILEKNADTTRYETDARELKRTFQEKYVTKTGLVVGDTQTALSLAIVFNLFETPEQAAKAGDRLAYLVQLAGFKVATGFAGTPVVTHALTQSGHHQIAYRMLREEQCPSWLYPITMGATTLWERWDSMLSDGSINPGEMTSFNHYALGSIVNWMHECIAGVRALEPGWKSILIAPIPGGEMRSAEVTYDTPYGRLECRWVISKEDKFHLDILVPVNTTAVVVLPNERTERRSTSSAALEALAGSRTVGSGRHSFTSRWSSTSMWPPKAIKLADLFEGLK